MEYIRNADLAQASDHLISRLIAYQKTEWIPVNESIGRICAQAVIALKSSPHYNSAAMDGIAVISQTTRSARPGTPYFLQPDEFAYVNTGAPIEAPFDAVIMIEDVLGKHTDQVSIIKPANPWQYIRQVGEDIVRSEMILASGARIRPIDIGAMLAGGIEQVLVFRKPIVAILPTGSEIVREAAQTEIGRITDSNSPMVSGLIKEWGGAVLRLDPVPDDLILLKQALTELLDKADLILILAGSSAGGKDFTRMIIEEIGGEVLEHGIAIKPGKPSILGLCQSIPIIGLPGYPVSCFLSSRLFVRPVLDYWLKQAPIVTRVQARLSQDIMSSLKYQEYLRLSLGLVRDRLIATPLPGGAGSTMSLVRCDGLGIIPKTVEGYRQGMLIDVELLKPLEHLRDKLVITGSHDVCLDYLADQLPLQSSHVGSLGGILAMLDQACHLAPIHLIDDTGAYNTSWVKKYFPQGGMTLIKGLKRKLGFAVAPGNPKGIQTIHDLKRVRFINRQSGAGTRLLLDKLLAEAGILPSEVEGYDNPRPTHLAVAQAVSSRDADVALATYAASEAFDLDFVEVALEEYDFLVRLDEVPTEPIQRFMAELKSESFLTHLEKIGGYVLDEVYLEEVTSDR